MEYFQLVDRNGVTIGSASRSECHGNPRLIHRVIHLHVLDRDGRLYLQKRAAHKDTNPGRWDTSVGGHVAAGEAVADALLREAREELSIDALGSRFLYAFLTEGSFESEYAHCYSLRWDGEIRPDPAEIEEGRFLSFAEVEAMMGSGALTRLFEREWPMFKAAYGADGLGADRADCAGSAGAGEPGPGASR
jgi:isopentenyldiphosphate isomerase